MDVRILGPLEAREDGRALDLGGPRPRALFTILLLHRGEVVSSERLVDELWGETPPRSASHLLHVYVSSLRKELGARLVTRQPGYLLDTADDDVDARRFERLVTEGLDQFAGGAERQASETLHEALELWRGPALSDFQYEPFAATEIARLEELRLTAIEARVEADLACGHHASLIGELGPLIADNPYRERLRAQLMLALYRSGRQADALASYRDARRALVDELGLEPSEELRDLQRRILSRDPGLAPPPTPSAAGAVGAPRARPRRSRRALAAIGSLLVAVAIGIALLAFDGDDTTNHQDAVAAIKASGGGVESYIGVGMTPRNLAFGEDFVWVLNADDQTVSQIDPESKRITKTFATGATPTEIAVGAGAVWIGNGPTKAEGPFGNSTVSVSRIDPESAVVTHKLVLPRPRSKAYLSSSAYGVGQLAVGAGAVWTINPDLTVSRIHPATGRLLATITDTAITPSSAIAAGNEGVWVIGQGASVTRIDASRNRTGQTIRFVATPYLSGIAVGAGSVWATVPEDGVVWRIEPGPRPLTRTVQVGFGVTNITFAEGALWATNFIDGTVSRIDPRTNTVTRRVRVGGTPQGVAVGAGAAWVSVAGATARGALPDAACGPIESGDREPDVLIASDLPLQGFASTATRAMTDAIRLVLRKHGFKAGRYAIGYASCDHSTARTGSFDFFKCASNGRSLAHAHRVVALIGPYDSDCAQVEIIVVNETSQGELAMISPATTYSGLTRGGPGAWSHRTDPTRYYPTGKRTFMRIPPAQDLQLAASALLLERLGLRRVYVVYGAGPWGVAAGRSFAASARKLRLSILGERAWDPSAASHGALAREVARSGAEAVLLDGIGAFGGSQVVRDLRKRLARSVVLVGGEAFSPIPDLLRVAGRSAHGMYVLSPSIPTDGLGAAGRRFVRELATTQHGAVRAEAPQAAQAAETVLQAIADSDGTRASVLAELRKIRVQGGLLGTFGFDARGDVEPARMAVYRVTGKSRGRRTGYAEFEGAVLDRVITVPARLRG